MILYAKKNKIEQITSDWNVVKLGEVSDILDGMRIPISSEVRQNMKGDIPYYGANGVIDYIDRYLFDEELILLAEDGGNFDDYAFRPIAYKIRGKSWVNNHAHVLRAKKGYYQDYIYYSIKHKNIIPFIRGGTRSKLNQSELRKITFFCPSYNLQKKIADILSNVDTTIEKTEALIEKYQKIKEGMMQDLFTRGIGKEGKLRPPYHEAPELYKKTELGMLPKEWEVITVSEFASDEKNSIVDGPFGSNLKIEHYESEGVPVIQSGFVTSNSFRAKKYQHVSKYKFMKEIRSKVSPGDIVMAKIGAQCGKCAKLPDNHEIGILAGNSLKISVAESNVNSYLELLLQYYYSIGRIAEIISTTAQPAVSLSKLKRMQVIRPTKCEQIKIDSTLSALSDYVINEGKYLSKLYSLKQALMQDLLTGKVRVPA